MAAMTILVFLTSACIMTIEIVAGRIIAPYAGVSLYTWTSVIGVVLAGMSAGGYLGGWLADRVDVRRALGWVLLAAAVTSGGILGLTATVGPMFGGAGDNPLRGVLLPVTLIFLLPAVCLAAISPLAYKLALRNLATAGGTVGRLAAAGALGSIVGTLGTGFYLIPWFGTWAITAGVAVILAVLALVYGRWRRAGAGALALLLAATVAVPARAGLLRSPCHQETAYYCVKVVTDYLGDGRRVLKKLVLDHLIHSAADLAEPEYLWYDYEKLYAWVIGGWARGRPAPAAFFIGGGGYTFPYYLEQVYPGSTIEVAEIDPEVTATALREFITGPTRILTWNGDARLVLRDLPPDRRYDLIFGDAFHGISVPYHLTTVEFARILRDRLQPDGLYVLNVVDAPRGKLTGAMAATLREVFAHVYVIPADHFETTLTHITHVVVASGQPLDWSRWPEPPADLGFTPHPWAGPPAPHLLTDDHAPVDNLLWHGIAAQRRSRR